MDASLRFMMMIFDVENDDDDNDDFDVENDDNDYFDVGSDDDDDDFDVENPEHWFSVSAQNMKG